MFCLCFGILVDYSKIPAFLHYFYLSYFLCGSSILYMGEFSMGYPGEFSLGAEFIRGNFPREEFSEGKKLSTQQTFSLKYLIFGLRLLYLTVALTNYIYFSFKSSVHSENPLWVNSLMNSFKIKCFNPSIYIKVMSKT